jgi:hypothetical protein
LEGAPTLRIGQEFDDGEDGHEQSDHGLGHAHRFVHAGVEVGQVLHAHQQQRAQPGTHDARQAETQQHAPVHIAPQQPELEQVVQQVYHGGERHRQFQWKEQREHRQQQRAQAEAADEREQGGHQGHQRDEQEILHFHGHPR